MLNSLLERIKQVAAVWLLLYGFYLAPLLSSLLSYYLLFHTPLWPLMLIYVLWMYLDRKTAHTTGRSWGWLRRHYLWRHLRAYFPQRMVSTAPLTPSRNYLVCLFPHGLLATGAITNFANETASDLYPGLQPGLFTLAINFMVPFFRELTLAWGLIAVSKESMLYTLGEGHSKLMAICPGGAAEAAVTEPNTYRTVLNRRKGFVRIAIQTGTSLVPAVVFGEPDLYNHWRPKAGSVLKRIQDVLREITGVSFCLFTGRGILQPWFGMMPYRVPVTTVVGQPISVEKNVNPSTDKINEVHQEFKRSIHRLFEEHKHKYVSNPDKTFMTFED